MSIVVSVIIPNYNHSQFLKQRIDSVLNQTFHAYEVIILDDASTDNSKDIIELYRGHNKVTQIFYNEINSGSTFKQWQKGIELASGKYIWIAESDDFCSDKFLGLAIERLENDKSSLFFCQSYNVDENNAIIKDNFWWTDSIKTIDWHCPFTMQGTAFIKSSLQFKNVIPNASAVVFKKDLFDFSNIVKYKTSGDWLFWINILSGKTVSYSPECLNFFRSHLNTTRNLNSRKKTLQREIEDLSIKHILFSKFRFAQKQDFLILLNKCIDIPSFTLYPMFLNLCFRFNLPKSYIFRFFKRKLVDRFL